MALVKYSRFRFWALPHATNDYKQISAFDARALPEKQTNKLVGWWPEKVRQWTVQKRICAINAQHPKEMKYGFIEKSICSQRVYHLLIIRHVGPSLRQRPANKGRPHRKRFGAHLASILFRLSAYLLFYMAPWGYTNGSISLYKIKQKKNGLS